MVIGSLIASEFLKAPKHRKRRLTYDVNFNSSHRERLLAHGVDFFSGRAKSALEIGAPPMAETRTWKLAHGRSLELGRRAQIMGVLNVTPDSFSDGGLFVDPDAAFRQAEIMLGQGASIIDVGGESTRPGAEAIDAAEEQSRVLPVIERLAERTGVLISVDTYRKETAMLAVKAGAHIVNDVWGLHRDPAKAEIAAETGAGMVIMHTGREREKLADVIEDQKVFFRRSFEVSRSAGLSDNQIVIDPGFGFAKDTEENLQLMARARELLQFGYPVLAGTSRKRFLGAVTGRDAQDRDVATAATSAILRLYGVAILRVHNVAFSADALAVADAMIAQTIDTGTPEV
jgi:dihydropteroate synthase